MTIYISGRITGDSGYREKFSEAEKSLKDAGYDTFNPATLCIPDGEWLAAMRAALRLMLKSNGVALLDDWSESKGAAIEARLAQAVGIPVKPLREWVKEEGGK
ncbi:MAG: DUF4406 domain-containing protein [Spirochaetaceae bacterium]|jgi:hypothetical protein|nr:DUF4406 domain-containing protein [Spirochaetaceae bacterium]